MTLFTRNRGMPTLSLKAKSRTKLCSGAWGGVCASLFLFVLVVSQLFTGSLYAQDLRNRTEVMYHLGTVIIAKDPLPDQVYNTQKYKFVISVIYFEKGTDNILTTGVGTGFTSTQPGVILTARHIISESILEVEKIKTDRIKTAPKFDYTRMFMGTIITPDRWINFPLVLAAVGESGTFKDMIALRVDIETMIQARIEGNYANPNPLNILTRPSEFADAKVGDHVYISGFAPVVVEYPDKNNKPVPVYVDLINRTFPAEVAEKIEDMPVNRAGVKLLYKLSDSAEPGFSGGMVLNERGQIIGMTIAMSLSKNFIYAISSQDIKQFLKDNKLK